MYSVVQITHVLLSVSLLKLSVTIHVLLRSINMNKASGGDRIPVELLQIVNDDAVKVLHSICQQI